MTFDTESPETPASLFDFLRKATQFLSQKGLPAPRLDAEVLLANILQLQRFELYTNFDRFLLPNEIVQYREFLRRREQSEPVAYIVGSKEFYGYPFKVNKNVLIPRPETELIIDEIINWYEYSQQSWQNVQLLDIGTGSGCISAAIALEIGVPQKMILTDISKDVLALAEENFQSLQLLPDKRIHFLQGDLFAPVQEFQFKIIVANPPYIDPVDKVNLMNDVVKYEPEIALFSEKKGNEMTLRIIEGADNFLLPGGLLLIEINEKSVAFWENYFSDSAKLSDSRFPLHLDKIIKDLRGQPRLMKIIKKS